MKSFHLVLISIEPWSGWEHFLLWLLKPLFILLNQHEWIFALWIHTLFLRERWPALTLNSALSLMIFRRLDLAFRAWWGRSIVVLMDSTPSNLAMLCLIEAFIMIFRGVPWPWRLPLLLRWDLLRWLLNFDIYLPFRLFGLNRNLFLGRFAIIARLWQLSLRLGPSEWLS